MIKTQIGPREINAPDVYYAYREACRLGKHTGLKKDWSHPVVRHAAIMAGYDRLTLRDEKGLAAFEVIYLQACNEFSAGKLVQVAEPVIDHAKAANYFGKHEIIRDGVMTQYEHVSSCDEAMAIMDKLMGNGDNKLLSFIDNLERRYKMQGAI